MYKKSVMHVQSCCFACLNLLLFLPFSLPSSSSLRKLPIVPQSFVRWSEGTNLLPSPPYITARSPQVWPLLIFSHILSHRFNPIRSQLETVLGFWLVNVCMKECELIKGGHTFRLLAPKCLINYATLRSYIFAIFLQSPFNLKTISSGADKGLQTGPSYKLKKKSLKWSIKILNRLISYYKPWHKLVLQSTDSNSHQMRLCWLKIFLMLIDKRQDKTHDEQKDLSFLTIAFHSRVHVKNKYKT